MTTVEDGLTGQQGTSDGAPPTQRDVDVSCHSCSPERTVFTESDNTDGWIATDTTVECRR